MIIDQSNDNFDYKLLRIINLVVNISANSIMVYIITTYYVDCIDCIKKKNGYIIVVLVINSINNIKTIKYYVLFIYTRNTI